MSTEEIKALVRRYYEAGNRGVYGHGNLEPAGEFLAETYTDHSYPPGAPQGFAGWKRAHAVFYAAFLERQTVIEDMVAEGDKVATRLTLHMTHAGVFAGIPPSGKKVRLPVIQVVRVSGGKVVEAWTCGDQLGLLQQLGAAPGAGTWT